MADTGDRTIRDRLAEALWLADGHDPDWCGSDAIAWVDEWPSIQEAYRRQADRLLASLPTVGLRIGEAG